MDDGWLQRGSVAALVVLSGALVGCRSPGGDEVNRTVPPRPTGSVTMAANRSDAEVNAATAGVVAAEDGEVGPTNDVEAFDGVPLSMGVSLDDDLDWFLQWSDIVAMATVVAVETPRFNTPSGQPPTDEARSVWRYRPLVLELDERWYPPAGADRIISYQWLGQRAAATSPLPRRWPDVEIAVGDRVLVFLHRYREPVDVARAPWVAYLRRRAAAGGPGDTPQQAAKVIHWLPLRNGQLRDPETDDRFELAELRARVIANIGQIGLLVRTDTPPPPTNTPRSLATATPAAGAAASATAVMATRQAGRNAGATRRAATETPRAATAAARMAAVRATQAALPPPALVYGTRDDAGQHVIVVADVTADRDGRPSELATFAGPLLGADVHPVSGVIVFVRPLDEGARVGLWSIVPGEGPRQLAEQGSGRDILSPRIAPDGQRVAYTVHGPRDVGSQLHVLDVRRDRQRVIARGLEVPDRSGVALRALGWSRDGATVYLLPVVEDDVVPQALFSVDVASGAMTEVYRSIDPIDEAALSPDGTRVAHVTWEYASEGGAKNPDPPYRLRLIDLATGRGRTVLEHDSQQLGALVWSPEGDRLLVRVGDPNTGSASVRDRDGDSVRDRDRLPRLAGVDLTRGTIWDPLAWLGPPPAGTHALTPRLWLPGERVVLEHDDRQLYVLDLDDGWHVDGDPADGSSSDEHWLDLARATAVEAIGYRLPDGVPAEHFERLLAVTERGTQPARPSGGSAGWTSPDGRWTARLLVSDLLGRGRWHRSRLEVAEVDGNVRHAAVDEYVPHAVCGADMQTIGWSAGGDLLYGRPGCGEGCARFAGWTDTWRLDPENGATRPLVEDGGSVSLAPDGTAIAYLRWHRDSDDEVLHGASLVVEDLASGTTERHALPVLAGRDAGADGRQLHVAAPRWSPDSRRLLVLVHFGSCPTEHASRIIVLDRATMSERYRTDYANPAVDARWIDADRLGLRALTARPPLEDDAWHEIVRIDGD